MQPGRLNKRITILERELKDTQVDDWDVEKVTWIPIADIPKVWGNIQLSSKQPSERFNNNRLEAEISHEITIRYRKNISRSNRVQYQDRMFRIQHIANSDEANRFLILYCIEEV